MRACIVLPLVAVALAGCGAQRLDPAIANRYVDAESHALCAVQSRAFPSQQALELRFRAIERARITDADRHKAAAAAEKDAALRARITNRVAQLCGSAK